jgi:oligoendopeptidase F
MTNEQKAQMYDQLMFEHTKLSNRISSIKGESFELNQEQIQRIRILESKVNEIMNRLSRL